AVQLRRIAVLAALLVTAFAATAQAAAPTLTASQYRAKANAICAQLNAYSPPSGTLAAQFGAVLAEAHRSLSSLKQLRPPQQLAAMHRQLTVLIAGGLDHFDSLLAQLRSGKLTETRFRSAVGRVSSKQEDALWSKLGAKVCAQT